MLLITAADAAPGQLAHYYTRALRVKGRLLQRAAVAGGPLQRAAEEDAGVRVVTAIAVEAPPVFRGEGMGVVVIGCYC